MIKIFISGKMSGIKGYNRKKFKLVEEVLEKSGYLPMNPGVLPLGFDFDDYLHICKSMIDVCDVVLALSSYVDSKGSQIEIEYAKEKKKIVLYQKDLFFLDEKINSMEEEEEVSC